MPRLSIVIPFMGELSRLEDTLVSVLENRPADCEILVVLSQPYGDPYALAGEVRFIPCAAIGDAFLEAQRRLSPPVGSADTPQRSALADCVAVGLAASKASIVQVLSCGVEATPGWTDAAMAEFNDPGIAVVAPVIVDRFERRKVLSAGMKYTAGGAVRRIAAGRPLERLVHQPGALCTAEVLASFYRKAALQSVMPWLDHTGGCLAGADWALALEHAGYRSIVEPGCLVAASKDVLAAPSALAHGMAAERLFWRWAPTRGWTRSLAGHAGRVALECLGCLVRPSTICRLVGRFWVGLQIPSHRQHWQRLVQPIAPPTHLIGPPQFNLGEPGRGAAV
ncbi:MAG: glycosyltransferase [Thermoguttaceae bacterium]